MPDKTTLPLPSKDSLPSKEELKEDVTKATKSTFQSLRALAAGGVGGICAVVVGHPFDLVKVRLQTAEKGVYTGAMDVVRKTIAKEGMARVGRFSILLVAAVPGKMTGARSPVHWSTVREGLASHFSRRIGAHSSSSYTIPEPANLPSRASTQASPPP